MASPPDSEETPCCPRTSDSVNNATGKVPLKQYRRQSTIDLANRSVRTDSVEEFLNGLLPFRPGRNSNLHRPTLTTNPFNRLKDADSLLETQVVELFVDAVNTHGLIPGLVMARCENRPDPRKIDETGQKIDAAFYHAANAPDDECPHWADQAGSAEFKSGKDGNAKDPWSDVDEKPEPESEERTKNRGQAMTFAELVHAMQQRVFLFMLYVIGRRFRLLGPRWGHLLAASRLLREPRTPARVPLATLASWRLCTRGGPLGHAYISPRTGLEDDGSTEDARYDINHEERALYDEEVVPEIFTWKYVREMFARSIGDPEWPRYKLHVNVAPRTTRAFLVGKPVVRADGLVGPGTRCYVAFDCEARRFVWLKDSWRASYELVETEGDVLASLNAADVRHVPTLVCHGDVRKQVTLTAQWWIAQHPKDSAVPAQTAPARRRTGANAHDGVGGELSLQSDGQSPAGISYRNDCPVRQLTHYRVVTEEVCMPLSQFQNGFQLTSLVFDCLNAHRDAMEKTSAGRLHRDITDRATLIYPRILPGTSGTKLEVRWRGILANWELSKALVLTTEQLIARQPERNGTWQFMSVNLLSAIPSRFSIADDLESLVLVLIYYAVRYLSSTIEENLDVANFLEDCFDSYSVGSRKVLCGERKMIVMKTTGELVHFLPGTGQTRVFFESPLDALFSNVLGWFRLHYKVLGWEAHVGLHPGLARAQASFQTPAKNSRPNGGPRRQGDSGGGAVQPKLKPPPTSGERGVASRLSDHSFIIAEFLCALRSEGWSLPLSDRHPDGDRVPMGWLSKLEPVPYLVRAERK